MMHFSATLPPPPGKNRHHAPGVTKEGKPYKYTTSESKAWHRNSLLLLRARGWRPLPPGDYSIEISTHCYSMHDLDASYFELFDLLKVVLGVDDKCFDRQYSARTRTTKNRRLDVNVWVYPKNTKTA
jgi:hypothetical protein